MSELTREELRRRLTECLMRSKTLADGLGAEPIPGVENSRMGLLAEAADLTVERLDRFAGGMATFLQCRLHQQAVYLLVFTGQFRRANDAELLWKHAWPGHHLEVNGKRSAFVSFIRKAGYVKWRDLQRAAKVIPATT